MHSLQEIFLQQKKGLLDDCKLSKWTWNWLKSSMEEQWKPLKGCKLNICCLVKFTKNLNKVNEQNIIRHDPNKPDFRRLNMTYSFSLIVDFASLYFPSRSCRALFVSSRSFYNLRDKTEVIRNIFAKIMWKHMSETRIEGYLSLSKFFTQLCTQKLFSIVKLF